MKWCWKKEMYCYTVSRGKLSLLLLVHLDDINFTHCFPYRLRDVQAKQEKEEFVKDMGPTLRFVVRGMQ